MEFARKKSLIRRGHMIYLGIRKEYLAALKQPGVQFHETVYESDYHCNLCLALALAEEDTCNQLDRTPPLRVAPPGTYYGQKEKEEVHVQEDLARPTGA